MVERSEGKANHESRKMGSRARPGKFGRIRVACRIEWRLASTLDLALLDGVLLRQCGCSGRMARVTCVSRPKKSGPSNSVEDL